MNMTPGHKPLRSKSEIEKRVKYACLNLSGSAHSKIVSYLNSTEPYILGVRGYFLNSLGSPGKNDRGIYDDAIFVVFKTVFASFNANCDPAVFRSATPTQKGIATLDPGFWYYKIGIHGLNKPKEDQYEALVQAAPVSVTRDGGQKETGFFGINIHRGSFNSVSSEGCQTIYPSDYQAFMALVKREVTFMNGERNFPYILVENNGEF